MGGHSHFIMYFSISKLQFEFTVRSNREANDNVPIVNE